MSYIKELAFEEATMENNSFFLLRHWDLTPVGWVCRTARFQMLTMLEKTKSLSV